MTRHRGPDDESVNLAIAGAPTIRGNAASEVQEEPHNYDLAIDAAKRVLNEVVDGSDPIVARVVVETIVLVKRLGAGGMGSVYLGVETQPGLHDRKYAVKVMPPTVAADELDRFMREVSAAARIRSARVAQVYRHGVFRDRRPWILMEYVDGISLEDEIRHRGVLDVDQALSRVGLALVRAIADVHNAKVVHKDLKPSNIMLERTADGVGEVKLLDFGIARVGGGEERVYKTNPNQGGGTPGYWSPESVAGQAIDYRTDVWGVGVILFEMLTGELPFGRPGSGAEINASIAAMMSSPPLSLNEVRRRKGAPPVSEAIRNS